MYSTQVSGQTRLESSFCGRPNGKSRAATQGPGSRKNDSNAAKLLIFITSCTHKRSSFKSHTAAVIGFFGAGALVKSRPNIFICGLPADTMPVTRSGKQPEVYRLAITFLLITLKIANTPFPSQAIAL